VAGRRCALVCWLGLSEHRIRAKTLHITVDETALCCYFGGGTWTVVVSAHVPGVTSQGMLCVDSIHS
jgi:hypothetical protein